MKASDNPTKVVDEVIAEVRAIKRGISECHGDDIDRLLASLISQERASGIGTAEQGCADPPATRSVAKSGSGENFESESDEHPQ